MSDSDFKQYPLTIPVSGHSGHLVDSNAQADFSTHESVLPKVSLEIGNSKWILLRQSLSVNWTADPMGKSDHLITRLATSLPFHDTVMNSSPES
jgi:hypothetical protein